MSNAVFILPCAIQFECLACAHQFKLGFPLDFIFDRDKPVSATLFYPMPFKLLD